MFKIHIINKKWEPKIIYRTMFHYIYIYYIHCLSAWFDLVSWSRFSTYKQSCRTYKPILHSWSCQHHRRHHLSHTLWWSRRLSPSPASRPCLLCRRVTMFLLFLIQWDRLHHGQPCSSSKAMALILVSILVLVEVEIFKLLLKSSCIAMAARHLLAALNLYHPRHLFQNETDLHWSWWYVVSLIGSVNVDGA